MVWTIIGGGDTQTLLASKKYFELYVLSGSVDAKTLKLSIVLALVPQMSHLVKLSPPNIVLN